MPGRTLTIPTRVDLRTYGDHACLTKRRVAEEASNDVRHDHAHDHRQLHGYRGGVLERTRHGFSEVHRAAAEREPEAEAVYQPVVAGWNMTWVVFVAHW